MINFKFISFSENLLEHVILENKNYNTLFLFPTINSKKEALKIYQPYWDFSETSFLTMEEWKKSLFLSSLPILKEEKRTLAFFSSLKESDKRFFRIQNYFQSIELAYKFFKFWEEINEEFINDRKIIQIIGEKETAQDWQLETYERLKIIRQNYYDFITTKGFTDVIFLYKWGNLNLTELKDYNQIVIVNQFYFTGMEKAILQKIDQEILIYYQLPEECINKETLTVYKQFSANVLKNIRTKEIKVIQTPDYFSMINCLFNEIENQRPDAIIDFNFHSQPYSGFFSPQNFKITGNQNFAITSIYRFFTRLYEILSSIIQDGELDLVPIQKLLYAFLTYDFSNYFIKETLSKESIISYFYELLENDYQYIDIQGKFFEIIKSEPGIKKILTDLFNLIHNFNNIKGLRDFLSLIDCSGGIEISKIITTNELTFSNISEIFYEMLADFKTLNIIEPIHKWNQFFPASKKQTKKTATATGILRLFLNYMKPKKIKYNLNFKNQIKITSLQDTRNLRYNVLAILNVIEGVLPPVRQTPFLFSENQRQNLSLKTFEDIKLRDKYYFYRIISQAENVILFTCKNINENIDISSFIEELKIYLPQDLFIEKSFGTQSYKPFYKNFLKNPEESTKPQKDIISKKEFYTFPFNKERDFPDHKVNLSYYSWQDIRRNPFMFYIRWILQLKPREVEFRHDFSEKFIGNLAHDIFTLIWRRLIAVYLSNKIHHNFLNTNEVYLNDSLKTKFKYDKKFKYKTPHNFSEIYFKEVFIPILKSGIKKFFIELHNSLQLSDKNITIFPEEKKRNEKHILTIDDLKIIIHGRTDLRIESDTIKYIFDYKTGKASEDKKKKFSKQLLIYELLYYLEDEPELVEKIQSYLYFVEENKLYSKKNKTDEIDFFKKDVEETITDILLNGFCIADKTDTKDIVEITRKDLYFSKVGKV